MMNTKRKPSRHRLEAIATNQAKTVERVITRNKVTGVETTVFFSNGEVERAFNFLKPGKKRAVELQGGKK